MNKLDAISHYYDNAKISYQDGWHLDKCLAMHFGIWDKGVKNLQQALTRENQILAEIINPKPNDYILDAGCGVGGSSIFLAKNFNCTVHGITLSQKQKESATISAIDNRVENKTTFSVMDYHLTNFEDESFNFVWMVESFCHAHNSQKVLQEMYRVLKPGGKIIIADVFLTNKTHSPKNKLLMTKWLNSWAVDSVEINDKMLELMKESGFKTLVTKDFTKEVFKSIKRLNLLGKGALAIGSLKRFFGKTYGTEITIQTSHGAVLSYQTLKKGIWDYLVITGSKP